MRSTHKHAVVVIVDEVSARPSRIVSRTGKMDLVSRNGEEPAVILSVMPHMCRDDDSVIVVKSDEPPVESPVVECVEQNAVRRQETLSLC